MPSNLAEVIRLPKKNKRNRKSKLKKILNNLKKKVCVYEIITIAIAVTVADMMYILIRMYLFPEAPP